MAASAYAAGDEIAQGFATAAGPLLVQACRLSGSDETALLEVDLGS